MDNTEQLTNSKVPKQLQPHVFKKGHSGNLNGRPPGPSLKEYAKKYLASLTEDERMEYLEGIDKKTVWEMAEGKAPQSVDHTTAGKELPTPILTIVKDEKENNTNK